MGQGRAGQGRVGQGRAGQERAGRQTDTQVDFISMKCTSRKTKLYLFSSLELFVQH